MRRSRASASSTAWKPPLRLAAMAPSPPPKATPPPCGASLHARSRCGADSYQALSTAVPNMPVGASKHLATSQLLASRLNRMSLPEPTERHPGLARQSKKMPAQADSPTDSYASLQQTAEYRRLARRRSEER